MPLETATYISDLVVTNPPTSDLETQGANHLQLIKSVLQNTFGTATRRFVGLPAISPTNNASRNVLATEAGTTILIQNAGVTLTFTLPVLASTDAGWECSFMKVSAGSLNPYLIAPPSGTIASGEVTGLSACRRSIPYKRTRVFWTGTAFIAERVLSFPPGTVIFNYRGALPVGWEWANGQTLSSAANYPEYNAWCGTLLTPDIRGVAIHGLDNPGGSGVRGLITVAGGNYDGTVFANSGGFQNHTLAVGDLPASPPSGSVSGSNSGSQTFNNVVVSGGGQNVGSASPPGVAVPGSITVNGSSFSWSGSLSMNNLGSGNAHSVLDPSIVLPAIIAVE